MSWSPEVTGLHWMPAEERVKFKGMRIAHKAFYKQIPVYIQDLLRLRAPDHDLRSWRLSQMEQSRLGGHLFSSWAPPLEPFPVDIRSPPWTIYIWEVTRVTSFHTVSLQRMRISFLMSLSSTYPRPRDTSIINMITCAWSTVPTNNPRNIA